MKIMRKIKKTVKRGAYLTGFILVGGYLHQTFSIANEARESLADETKKEPENAIEVFQEQYEKSIKAIERAKENKKELVKHRTFQIEQKREEIQKMEDDGFYLNGMLADDMATITRYEMRKLYLENDWPLGNLITEQEMMHMADINNKIAEGRSLTQEEEMFAARINGTLREYEKARGINTSQTGYSNTNYHVSDAAVTASGFGQVKPRMGVSEGRTVYIFESQEDLTNGIEPYMAEIQSSPGSYIVRLNNQRSNAFGHLKLDEAIIDAFNARGVAIEAKQLWDQTEIKFKTGGFLNNKIDDMITPYKQNSLLDYVLPEKRDERQIKDYENLQKQKEAEALNAVAGKTDFWSGIKNKIKIFK